MSLRINTNVAALNAHRQLNQTDKNLQLSMERLSSGYRINHAKDDVSGLAIANATRAEMKAMQVAQRNIVQAQALLQSAEGGAGEIEKIVERLKELATSAANAGSSGARLQAEASELLKEIDQIATDGGYLSGAINMTFQIGTGNVAAADQITVTTTSGLLSSNLGLSTLDISTVGGAQTALGTIDSALASVNVIMGQIGAADSRMDFISTNLAVTVQNMAAVESSVRDVDMALEMTNLTKNQILMQAGTAMLAQANVAPQNVLALLGK